MKRRAVVAVRRRPVVAVGVDMRLTTDDVAKLTPEQARAVFEGVGALTAETIACKLESTESDRRHRR